jgi:hypothetical protein
VEACAVVTDGATLKGDAAVASDAQHGIQVWEAQVCYAWLGEYCITADGEQAFDCPACTLYHIKAGQVMQQQEAQESLTVGLLPSTQSKDIAAFKAEQTIPFLIWLLMMPVLCM